MFHGGARNIHPAQHPCNFFHPPHFVKVGHSCLCNACLAFFADKQMLMSLCGNLRLVGYTQNLYSLAQLTQQPAYHFGNGAANADINFIEYQCGRAGGLGGNDLYGQTDA